MQLSVNHAHRAGRGFTLIELIVTLAIAAILATMVIPSFNTLSVKNLQADEVNTMIHHFYLARSLSTANETRYALCPSSDGERCTNTADWSQGYILFEDSATPHNGLRDPNEQLQAAHQPTQDARIDIDTSEHRNRVVYQADGHPVGYDLTMTFCDPDERIPPKAVILSNLGRVRVSETNPDGTPLSCGG
jgi:type IV fimbrial biogenesis protein FimT